MELIIFAFLKILKINLIYYKIKHGVAFHKHNKSLQMHQYDDYGKLSSALAS